MPETKEEKIRRLNQELEDFIAAEVAKSHDKPKEEKSFEEVLQVSCYPFPSVLTFTLGFK